VKWGVSQKVLFSSQKLTFYQNLSPRVWVVVQTRSLPQLVQMAVGENWECYDISCRAATLWRHREPAGEKHFHLWLHNICIYHWPQVRQCTSHLLTKYFMICFNVHYHYHVLGVEHFMMRKLGVRALYFLLFAYLYVSVRKQITLYLRICYFLLATCQCAWFCRSH
jgi:hypothetical protein